MLAHFDAMMECHLSTHLAAMDLCVTSEFQIQRTVPISKLVCCYFTAFLCIFEPAAESQEKCILHSTSIRHALPKTITHTFRCCKRHTRKRRFFGILHIYVTHVVLEHNDIFTKRWTTSRTISWPTGKLDTTNVSQKSLICSAYPARDQVKPHQSNLEMEPTPSNTIVSWSLRFEEPKNDCQWSLRFEASRSVRPSQGDKQQCLWKASVQRDKLTACNNNSQSKSNSNSDNNSTQQQHQQGASGEERETAPTWRLCGCATSCPLVVSITISQPARKI